jgi:exodeoxyribonuclease V alpha subunit
MVLSTATELLAVDGAHVERALDALARRRDVVVETRGDVCAVYLPGLYLAEVGIAGRLLRLAAAPPPEPVVSPDVAIAEAELAGGITFAPTQRAAVATALTQNVVVITGGPGTGKTTLVQAIIEAVAREGVEIALAAPTGRAAKRLSEAAGRPAQTLHRLLRWSPAHRRFLHNENAPLDVGLVVVDETSMLDAPLAHALLRAVPADSSLILVGDADQLPSVGPGQVFADIIQSGTVPVVRLREIFRQGEGSETVATAHAVNAGRPPRPRPLRRDADFAFLPREAPEDIVRCVEQLVGDVLPTQFGFDPLEDIFVLTAVRRGDVGTEALNRTLQVRLNPDGRPLGRGRYRLGDRVVQTRNAYDRDVYNGDLGRLTAYDDDTEIVTVTFDGRNVPYDIGELDTLLAPAYALSVHKWQGGEVPCAISSCPRSSIRCCVATCSTRQSPVAASSWSSWAARAPRRSPLAARRPPTAARSSRIGSGRAGHESRASSLARRPSAERT